MIRINYEGRLGNNLFQYSVARILSENLNQKIITEKPDFPFDNFNGLDENDYKENIIVNDNNFLEILKIKNIEANLILNGYFQNKFFVLEYKKKIKDIIEQNLNSIDGVYLHYRLGDTINLENWNPKYEYYTYCLDKILNKSNKEVFITTDSPHHYSIQKLAQDYKAKIINNNAKDSILLCSRFTNKILSLGTFSWWIGFLNNQHNIYCPNLNDYKIWHGDIFVFDDWNIINKKDFS